MKSDVSDLLEVIEQVYIDSSMKCSADVFDIRDLETIKSRVENEGVSFLTITLPQFCKDFERSLEEGVIDPACFTGFHRLKHEAIPEFLQGMLGQIFDRKTGKVISYETLNRHESIDWLAASDVPTVVESVRQICRTFSKVELDCSPKRIKAALDSFYEIERELQEFSAPDEDVSKFLDISRLLWDNMVRDFRPDLILPKHGPGATADKISGNGKYVWRRWHDRLEPYFPLVDNGYPLGIPLESEELEIVTIIPEYDEQPVRVITVPKTLKSPRVIAVEPVCMQYVQQGIRDYLYDKLESYWLTKSRINFRDQEINQQLALTSSSDGRLATIDLSEASDRVPLDLAIRMFDSNPDLRDSILCCRSTKAQLPDGRIISPLRKFTSMGSALCFPIEAMYFYTICVMALMEANNLSYTRQNIFIVSRDVYVYGDDIVVPSTNADVVLAYLRKYNCKVNSAKTFYRGNFRESCGLDAYNGYEVTPTYVRNLCPENKRAYNSLISWCATANLFYKKGYWRTASLMFKKLEKILGPLPYVRETSSVLGRYSFLGYESVEKWNRDLQRFEVKGWSPKPVYRSDELEGWSALMKCFMKMHTFDRRKYIDTSPNLGLHKVEDLFGEIDRISEMLFPTTADQIPVSYAFRPLQDLQALDDRHLVHSALHGAVTLKRRWAPTH
uniref:RNA-directed RNA polymerase n=1 Tax=Leviviridae sp. TaxID=2027243 RepID=A0A514D3J1_9VIRU|nr:MAG: RNA-dependent RNA polymerase [Leviviridae sp.]